MSGNKKSFVTGYLPDNPVYNLLIFV